MQRFLLGLGQLGDKADPAGFQHAQGHGDYGLVGQEDPPIGGEGLDAKRAPLERLHHGPQPDVQ